MWKPSAFIAGTYSSNYLNYDYKLRLSNMISLLIRSSTKSNLPSLLPSVFVFPSHFVLSPIPANSQSPYSFFSVPREDKETGRDMGFGGETSVLDGFIDKAGGCAVVDGGLGTQLERHGARFNDPLWSALCLIKSPDLVKKVHLEYLEAGADILVTSSYQATIPGFLARGLSIEEAETLLRTSVKLAVEARDKYWDDIKRNPLHNQKNRALVAASIGSYGAYLADGSEYSGNYGPLVNLEKLKDFHRRRLQVLVEAGADLLAFETIPNKLEAQVCVELLEEENVQIPSWICFSCLDGKNAPSGESFKECLDVLNSSKRVAAVGINCAPPHFILDLIRNFKELTGKAIVVYPNSGRFWDGITKRWLPSECFDDDKFEFFATRWRDAGASLIGGCCQTTPDTIQAISKALREGKLC